MLGTRDICIPVPWLVALHLSSCHFFFEITCPHVGTEIYSLSKKKKTNIGLDATHSSTILRFVVI